MFHIQNLTIVIQVNMCNGVNAWIMSQFGMHLIMFSPQNQNVQKATNVTAEKHLVSRVKRGEVNRASLFYDLFSSSYFNQSDPR